MSGIYRCWNPDTGDADDGRDVTAFDAMSAATTFARWYDAKSTDYGYATHGGVVAISSDGIEVGRYRVTGEQEIVYTARAAQGASDATN